LSLLKVIPAYAHPESLVCQLVKVSSRGLRGHDLRAFSKQASPYVAEHVRKVASQLAPGEELVHLLALGATESSGVNRNGDGFPIKALRQYHPTFVKHAKFYRDHANRDPQRSYGHVLDSLYNETMHRVELLCPLYATKEAADRHRALVADREMSKLARGEIVDVSMACSVPFDICSWCGNKAPRTHHYCTDMSQGGQCKAGGLRDNIGAIIEIDGGVHHLHAINDHPTFIDISHVERGADRTAKITGLLKSANHGVVKSAELAVALGVTLPASYLLPQLRPEEASGLLKVAYLMADIDSKCGTGVPPVETRQHTAEAIATAQTDFPKRAGEYFRALADERSCLPLGTFVALTTGTPADAAEDIATVVRPHLQGVFTRLVRDADVAEKLACTRYLPTAAGEDVRTWARKYASDFSLRPQAVSRRRQLAAIRGVSPLPRVKAAAEQVAAGQLAEEYACYQLAFLNTLSQDVDFPLTAQTAVLQNWA
jgi:hypothetical protein